jgi:hypothetical protein
VEQAIKLLEPLVDEALDARGDPNVPAGKFEAHDW